MCALFYLYLVVQRACVLSVPGTRVLVCALFYLYLVVHIASFCRVVVTLSLSLSVCE